jgi:hypothetical protein
MAMHESGKFTSNIYRTKNNAFGYGGDGDAAWTFGSVYAGAKELRDWLNRRGLSLNYMNSDQFVHDIANHPTHKYFTGDQNLYKAALRFFLKEVPE